MSAKSDFAHKLLNDLRQRKERMGGSQNTSRQQFSHTSSRDMHGNAGGTTNNSRQINALESASSRTGNTRIKAYGGSKSISTKESSNQIVLYESGQSSKQVKDLSMAIDFALENSGNLSKIGTSSTNPLVNFFNRFGRKSSNSQKISFDNQSFPNYEFSSVSHIHVSEISKGVTKLHKILKACSNGLCLDRNSIEVGKELLKGAIDLEESLRMLANMNSTRQKGCIKLLDEDEDDQDTNVKTAESWKLDRPKFSFDGASRDKYSKRQQLALTYSDETSQSSKMVPYNKNLNTSQSSQEKGKISNVIAKLMGLEELPQKESTSMQTNLKGKVSGINTKLLESFSRDVEKGGLLVTEKKTIAPSTTPLVRVSKKSRETMMNNERYHGLGPNQVDRKRRKNLKMGGEKKTIETSHSRTQLSNTKLQKNAENRKISKVGENTHIRIEDKVSANYLEKGNTEECTQDKHREEQKGQNLMAKKHDGRQVESTIVPKAKKSASIDSQKKLSSEKFTLGSGRVMKTTENFPKRNPPKKDAPTIDTSHKTAANQENFEKKGGSHDLSPTKQNFDTAKESINPVITSKKSTDVSATRKKPISAKIQESGNARSIDVMMSRRDAKLNHLARSGKQSESMLNDLKQRLHKRSNARGGVNMYNASEIINEPIEKPGNLENEDDHITTLHTTFSDKCQIQNIPDTQELHDNCGAITSEFEKVSDDIRTMERPYAIRDEQELTQSDPITGHEESIKLHNIDNHDNNQRPASARQEQLTEPERELKEILIRSQLFLSTAEALFKLNIPVNFLHAGDHDNEVGEEKVILDCAYEAMKRKAKRNEATFHPYMKNTITCMKVRSLDDLVKQLCKELEMLKDYGGNGCDTAEELHKMIDKDFHNNDPDINCMWDYEWNKMLSVFSEKEEVVRDVEKHVLNGLLNEITNDLVLVTISA